MSACEVSHGRLAGPPARGRTRVAHTKEGLRPDRSVQTHQMEPDRVQIERHAAWKRVLSIFRKQMHADGLPQNGLKPFILRSFFTRYRRGCGRRVKPGQFASRATFLVCKVRTPYASIFGEKYEKNVNKFCLTNH